MALSGPIAILGWGSLIWDLDDLAEKVAGGWQMRAGPRLAMEFSRISPKRKMALVVCLDEVEGTPCATHAIRSVRGDLAAARADLAARERGPVEEMGWTDGDGGEGAGWARVSEWCRQSGHGGAVWTGLRPNFREVTGEAFSPEAARGYLRGLDAAGLAEGFRYIRNAPPTTRTRLRRMLAADPWWRGLRRRA